MDGWICRYMCVCVYTYKCVCVYVYMSQEVPHNNVYDMGKVNKIRWSYCASHKIISFFLRFHLFIFRERGKEGKRQREKHQHVVTSRAPPTGDLASNSGMCPDWESNLPPFGSQAGTQSTEPHQPRPRKIIYDIFSFGGP